MAKEIAVRVYRGEAVEAEHCADIAVVDGSGRLTHYYGQPEAVYMARSAIKPFQVLPLILTGGLDRFGFSRQQLAIMCSSHSGTDEHCRVVRSCLETAGFSPDDLQCGADWPLYIQFENIFPVNQDQYDPLRNDCSGKHAGFLALTRHLGEPVSDYLNPESKAQQLVKHSVADLCEYPIERMTTAIDGCSAPNFSLGLTNLAIGFRNLAGSRAPKPEVRAALKRVRDAMTSYPYLIAGHKRFCYDFMRAFAGKGVTKLGAESIQGIGFAEPILGIAVKVVDGGSRALGPICVHLLKQLGLAGGASDFSPLQPYESPPVRNARDLFTGRIVVDFELRKA